MTDDSFDRNIIDQFLESRIFAVVGVSKNEEKYGFKVFQDLKRGGYTVYPINPHCEEISGDRCYPNLESLPEKPDVVEFVCPPPITEGMVKKLPGLDIDKVWMQPGAESREAIAFCEQNGIKVLHDICVMVEMRKKEN